MDPIPSLVQVIRVLLTSPRGERLHLLETVSRVEVPLSPVVESAFLLFNLRGFERDSGRRLRPRISYSIVGMTA